MKTIKAIEATRTALLLGFCLVGASFGVIGCQNTAEGMKDDASKNTAAVGNAADKAGEATKNAADNAANATKNAAGNAVDATKNAASNAGEATGVTPKVKLAIVADKQLNDTKNLINVDTKNGVVYLKGHVISNDEKKRAGDIAAKTLKESGSKETVMNQLTVESH